MSQTSVKENLDAAFAGMLADSSYVRHVASYVNEEASAEMPFGVMVAQGTDDDDALLPDAAGDTPIGVVVHSHAYAKPDELGDDGVKPDVSVGVLTRGVIWVQPEDTVSPGDDVRYRISGTGQEGAFLKTAAVGETVQLTAGARWLTSGDSDTPAQLEIDAMAFTTSAD